MRLPPLTHAGGGAHSYRRRWAWAAPFLSHICGTRHHVQMWEKGKKLETPHPTPRLSVEGPTTGGGGGGGPTNAPGRVDEMRIRTPVVTM